MKPRCPHIGKPCREHGCTHYVQLHGSDPQTGEALSTWMCVDVAMVKVALEGNKDSRGTGAAVESFRNAVVRAAEHAALTDPARMRLVESD